MGGVLTEFGREGKPRFIAAEHWSADLQSAVSRVFNPLTARNVPVGLESLPIAIRRYSRLETCATGGRRARLRPHVLRLGQGLAVVKITFFKNFHFCACQTDDGLNNYYHMTGKRAIV